MSIARFLCEPDAGLRYVAPSGNPTYGGARVPVDPIDDGDPYYLPADEAVEPYRVPGWARG